MNPPKQIDVMGQRFIVEAVADPSYSIHREAEGNAQGGAIVSHGLIRYRPEGPDSSKDNERDTILHELVHVLFRMGGYEHMLDKDHHDDYAEALVGPLSTTLLAAMRANPELVAYLLSE